MFSEIQKKCNSHLHPFPNYYYCLQCRVISNDTFRLTHQIWNGPVDRVDSISGPRRRGTVGTPPRSRWRAPVTDVARDRNGGAEWSSRACPTYQLTPFAISTGRLSTTASYHTSHRQLLTASEMNRFLWICILVQVRLLQQTSAVQY